jgi:hypothetical protein
MNPLPTADHGVLEFSLTISMFVLHFVGLWTADPMSSVLIQVLGRCSKKIRSIQVLSTAQSRF